MHVLVLGAGLLGVSTAHFLQQQGHQVTVVDRQAAPAAETSLPARSNRVKRVAAR